MAEENVLREGTDQPDCGSGGRLAQLQWRVARHFVGVATDARTIHLPIVAPCWTDPRTFNPAVPDGT